jgi:cob(I)alamin adenosyltransferase
LISFGYKAKVVDSVTAEKPEEARQVINLSEIKAQDEKIALLGNEITELRKHFDYLEAIEKLINNEKKTKNDAESAQKTLKILSICALVIAVLAIGVGSTVLFFNLQLEETVEEAQNSLLDIEDEMSARETNPNDEKIKTVQGRIAELQETLDASAKELDLLKAEILSDKSESSSLNTVLKTEITQLTDKVIVLEAELERLKRARSVRSTVRKVKKKSRKPREWVVNLVSFKQRWYTDKKVESFSQQGIPTEVINVDVNGVQWFRIRAVGFFSKAAARDYAEKAKQVLNLGSVWVSVK